MLKVEENYTEQMKTITDSLPAVRGKLSGEYLKLFTNTHDQQSDLIAVLEELDYEFYAIKSKSERPIKVVIKGLPRDTDTNTIHHELIMLGYTVDKETHLRPKHNINISNCKCYRNDRQTAGPASGGILILIKKSISLYNTPTPQLFHVEATTVTINP
ncbi:putative RNA-directed DNA polymerase from transposon X-element [Trichonephila clavipes]|nr:putative RNA-directed DNA polymerase from transposon X-element [Trichonephila clavipes]